MIWQRVWLRGARNSASPLWWCREFYLFLLLLSVQVVTSISCSGCLLFSRAGSLYEKVCYSLRWAIVSMYMLAVR